MYENRRVRTRARCAHQTDELARLIAFLCTDDGLRVFHAAYVTNMRHKAGIYEDFRAQEELEVARQLAVIRIKTPQLKRAAGVCENHDNWAIFAALSEQYTSAMERAAAFEALRERARERLVGVEDSAEAMHARRRELLVALRTLDNFSAQAHIVGRAVDIVGSFLKNPRLFRQKLMNFVLVGGAGTGKTTLAQAIGDAFAKAGIFVGNAVVTAGRAELVGQYEGQTVTKTRNFLVSNLDNGVVFVDEAYAITPWQDGKPEGYGAEAATAMVEFMTRYQGLYCLIVAGYERQMRRYFLCANEGLPRRFPNKYVLSDMTPDALIRVFQRKLLEGQGLSPPDGCDVDLSSRHYFSDDAWAYLRALVCVSRQGRVVVRDEYDEGTREWYRDVRTFEPSWPKVHTLFAHQAGAMANLADEALTVLAASMPFTAHRNRARSAHIEVQGRETMRRVVVATIQRTAFSDVVSFLDELKRAERLVTHT